MSDYKKIGNTSYHKKTISEMTLKDFKAKYSGIIKGQDLEAIFAEITGRKQKNKSVENTSSENLG